jgi:hypothetical protein
MIDQVFIQDDWMRNGHWLVILGRPMPGAPRHWLRADGEWEPLVEGAQVEQSAGFRLPEGALDAIVSAYAKVATPHPATERHLEDAVAVRDRLLALVEKKR